MNKETLRRGITGAARLLPLRRRVLLESSPDLACNTYPVFLQLLQDPALEGIELTWLVKDPGLWRERFPQKRVSFVEYDPADRRQRLRAVWLALTSRCVVFCNKTIWSPRKGQLSLFLGHGTPIKQCKGFYTPGKFCNRWVYPAEQVRAVMEDQLGLAHDQGLLLGYPRNDALFHPEGKLDRLVDRRGRKVLFWLPTFRQHNQAYASNYTLPGCGLPLLDRPGALEDLNQVLEQAGVMVVLKPHPVQDVSAIRAGSLSAFQLISDEDLRRENLQLYEVLADADGLLTDYSSVYCDFLLTGKPIGLTLDDLHQYQASRGLVMEDMTRIVKGRYLYTLEDLQDFLRDLGQGIDREKAQRQAACDYYNHWQDDRSARRTAAVIRTFLETGGLEA